LGTITAGILQGVTMSIGSGNNVFKADTNGIYLGNANFNDAPFKVDMQGNITAETLLLSDTKKYFQQFISWNTLQGGFSASSLATPYGTYVYLPTDSTVNTTTYVRTYGPIEPSWVNGKKHIYEIGVIYFGTNTAQTIWLFFERSNVSPPTETFDHIGFKIINARIYASSADNTTQKLTDTGVNIITGPRLTRFKMIFTSWTECKYYVDNVLVATHTTNLPRSGITTQYLNFCIRNEEAVNKWINVGRIFIENEV